MAFKDNVFVNCPFDEDYLPLLRPLLFCVIYLGLTPRIALEALDSGAPRFEKIVSLIRSSKYAIHDLSRLQSSAAGEYFRLNMPFELGLDVGCRLFRSGQAAGKRCLILEAERYRYQAAISDLSNSDIATHSNEPVNVVTEVRNWLNTEARLRAPGPAAVWARFNEFMADNYDALKLRGFSDKDVDRLPVGELIVCMQDWVEENA
jgi:hypothetical protein